MTEYEIRDLMNSTLSGSTSVLSVMISVISAYLIVSWLVGDRLTRSQVTWINLLFVTFGSLMILRWVTGYRIAMGLQASLLQHTQDVATIITIELVTVVAGICVAAFLGSLKFMWDVRHPKTE